ncbi:MAG: 3-deoxy-D-manno-octulosonic acid transferase [Candidatus Aminicenantaceae bacterium]
MYLKKRLGYDLPEERNQKQSIWIHAVSVGEVLSLQNLIQELKVRHPSWTINFSSLTNTGFRMAQKKLREVDNIFFIPLDFVPVVKKFFKTFTPKVLILTESEFWPNLLRIAKVEGVSVLLINGRISERSFRRYRWFRFLTKTILKKVDLFLVQTEQDKKRLEKIGINSNRISVAGNLKAEIELPLLSEDEISSLKRELSIQEGKKVIVAGSTRKGEEEQLLEAFLKAKEVRNDILLVLAPRHPERFNEVEKASQNFSFIVQKRTKVNPKDKWDILILDTIGELAQFYALSDIAFVGGSLVPWGGHNLLEPAFYKKPVFFGPHMHNFEFLAEKFAKAGTAKVIRSKEDLVEMFLIRDEEELCDMGMKAKETLESLQGATEKTVAAIEELMLK